MLLSYIPPPLSEALRNVSSELFENCEEIRIRCGQPVKLIIEGNTFSLKQDGTLCKNGGITADRELIDHCFQSFTKMSPYAYKDELSRGFITLEGGHRAGFCGSASPSGLKDISSVNLRIAHEKKGFANIIEKSLFPLKSCLVISPPGGGKTTLLRDMSRIVSDTGVKVCIADSRFEIASVYDGRPQLDVGANTDVLSGFKISDAVNILLRTMSPDVLVTDEIGGPKDAAALSDAVKSGVRIFASAHGQDVDDVKSRLGAITDFFDIFITIQNEGGMRNVTIVS